jgi:hypothetical protein
MCGLRGQVIGRDRQTILRVVNEDRVAEAEKSLCAMMETLDGKSLIDAGSGSGPSGWRRRDYGEKSLLFRLRSSMCRLHSQVEATLFPGGKELDG